MTMKKNILCTLILAGSIMAISFAVSAATITATTPATKSNDYSSQQVSTADLERLSTVISEVKKYYVRKVDDKTLFDNAISGMLSGLDPHSEYLNKSDLEALSMVTVGKFEGIGVEVIPYEGLIKIISPLDDSPAYKTGIKAGDVIVEINGKLAKDLTLDQAVSLMRGPKGSKLKLLILRKDSIKPLAFIIKRDVIKMQTVKAKMLEDSYAYVRISFFQEPTERDLRKAIKKLKQDAGGNLNGLILDLRNDPGGLLDSSVEVADDFLDANKLKGDKLIVYTKGSNIGTQITAKATSGELLPNVPMVVLINEGSASASEIVAGALQDYKRALIVGTRSFGKGSVQTLLPVDKESAIKLTTALYYTPLGRSIQAKGIEPDVEINQMQLPKNIETDLDSSLLSESNLDGHIKNSDSTTPNDNSEINDNDNNKKIGDLTSQDQDHFKLAKEDYQLYEALNILKAITKINVEKN
jgi:carboxyl-terminal processing protease